jgi:tRNA (guanine-N7-)-methyltransferase
VTESTPHSAPPLDVVVAPGSLEGRLDFARMFGGDGPPRRIELEVGCGKGKFLLAAAQAWPDRAFLAVEHSRALLRKVRDRVVRAGLLNVRLFHGNARDVVQRLVPEGSLSRIHVYFPDPWPKRRHAKHRLFAGAMPDAIARSLHAGGELLLATDHDPYFREVIGRLAVHAAFVRTTTDAFRDIPTGGFEAIFAAQSIPVFRGCWQKVSDASVPPD